MKVASCSTIAIMGIIIVSSFLLFGQPAHGIWVRQSALELLNGSDTIFVGNITSANTLQVEKKFTIVTQENGTDRTDVENYTIPLDKYNVDVEEFLKNPRDSNNMTVMQPTISGAPGRLSPADEFKVGDRVLFYVQKLDGNYTYYPESFEIPKICNSKDVISQERPASVNEFLAIQDGNKVDFGNITANRPVHFVWNRDVGTLYGKSYDLLVYMTTGVGANAKVVLNKGIHAESKPCQWVSSAEWEFVPHEGTYGMDIRILEDGAISSLSSFDFSVKPGTVSGGMPPLQQIHSGVGKSDIVCDNGLYMALRSFDKNPVCLKAGTISKLASRGFLYGTKAGNENYATVIIPPGSENQASHNTYSPDVVTVVIGINNTVRWVSQSDTANAIVPDMPLVQSGIPFGSNGVIKPLQSYQYTFTDPGTFAYHTEPHPWMKGIVIVLPHSDAGNTPRAKTSLVENSVHYYLGSNLHPGIVLNDYFYDGINQDGIVRINNQTYYQTTLGYDVYNLPKNTPVQFHGVLFSFPGGTLITPGGAFVNLDVKFQDNSEEIYGGTAANGAGTLVGGILIPTPFGPHVATNSTTVLGNHTSPQAGITIYNDKIKLLVSKQPSEYS